MICGLSSTEDALTFEQVRGVLRLPAHHIDTEPLDAVISLTRSVAVYVIHAEAEAAIQLTCAESNLAITARLFTRKMLANSISRTTWPNSPLHLTAHHQRRTLMN